MATVPSWPGAAELYQELGRISRRLGTDAYTQAARRTHRALVEWSVPESVKEIQATLDRGDEAECRAALARWSVLIDAQ